MLKYLTLLRTNYNVLSSDFLFDILIFSLKIQMKITFILNDYVSQQALHIYLDYTEIDIHLCS